MRKILDNCMFWKLVLFKGLNGYFIVVATTLCAADTEHRLMSSALTTFLLAMVAGGKFLEGFIDDTVRKTRDSGNPFGRLTTTQQKELDI